MTTRPGVRQEVYPSVCSPPARHIVVLVCRVARYTVNSAGASPGTCWSRYRPPAVQPRGSPSTEFTVAAKVATSIGMLDSTATRYHRTGPAIPDTGPVPAAYRQVPGPAMG